MNAPVTLPAIAIRTVDLSDANEAARIDAFVRETPGGTPFHLPRWIQSVEQGCGQPAHMLVAERGGALRGVLPLSEVHSALFGRALVSSGFAVDGGILAEDVNAERALAEASWALAERLSCPEIELRGGRVPEGWQRREGIYANFRRELGPDEESIMLAIRKKQRAEVRKGLKNGLRVEIGTSQHDRDAHYHIYAISVRNLGTPVFPQALFDAVLDSFGEDADISSVWQGDKPVAAVLSLYFNDTVMPYWGGGTFEARHLRANEVVHFSLMTHARNRGCTHFDFGRSKVGTGPYHYKKNWGFEPQPLVYAGRTADGAAPREINPLSPRYRLQIALWKRLPLPIANRLGPHIARGVG